MALKLVFNPFSSKFDYIDVIDTSAFAPAIPQIIANGVTFTVSINTQVSFTEQILTQTGGSILTEGTGSITWIN